MLETPYSGDVDRNVRYLLVAMADAGVLHHELPYASHAYLTQHPMCRTFYVSDYDPRWTILGRDGAIARSQRIRHDCDQTVFYTDLGWSRGMTAAREYCDERGLPYTERRIDRKRLAAACPSLPESFTDALVGGQKYESFFLD